MNRKRYLFTALIGLVLMFSGIWAPAYINYALLPENWTGIGAGLESEYWWSFSLYLTLLIGVSSSIIGGFVLVVFSLFKFFVKDD